MTTQPKPSTPRKRVQGGLLDPQMLLRSTPDALRKLDPRTLWRTPVRFIVEIGALWDALCRAYAAALGFDHATGGDEVFRDLVLTRIIEPTSKQDPLRVLAETGVEPVSYRTVTRRLPAFAKHTLRQALHPMAVMPRRPLVDLEGQGDFADAIQHW